ncbi:hypothetical protein Smp_075330 [Schistosoma mansoni]|uniref:PID domain-containing protein n=1 Tax=Schistosoma mansoni TaxID=6183 RepID=G4LX34_SCHMA|nr:hypothetical protein Smp_075330 [Schistosoma mansoni]|eukprot:XP_018645823.1 hypothetical protein Smp_075330 [Schistosoma mansoni]
MSRKSIKKTTLSSSVPSLIGKDYDLHEPIYFKCRGKLFLQQTLKRNEEFDTEMMKKLVNIKKTVQPQERMIYLTENGLRIKAYKNSSNIYTRIFLRYDQIETIYMSEGKKYILVLGIISKDKKTRAYECTRFKDRDEFKELCNLLVQACENNERKLIHLNRIGTLSMSSLYESKKSNRGSLGSIVWTLSGESDNEFQSQLEDHRYQNDLKENENDVRRVITHYSQQGSVTSIISSSLRNEKGSVNSMNRKIETSDSEDSDSVHHYNGVNGGFNDVTYEDDDDDYYASEIYKADDFVEPILTPIFHADDETAKLFYRTGYDGDSLEENYEKTDLYPPSEWPAGVTFICPDAKSGATITHLGPVYLYSERFVDVNNDCIEKQTAT